MGPNCKKALRIHPQLCPSSQKGEPSTWSSFLPASESSCPPLPQLSCTPSPFYSPFQAKSKTGVLVAFLGVSRKGGKGVVTSERVEFSALRSCWHGDVGPVPRPKVHHQDLETTRPPGRNWKNKGEENQNEKKTSEHPSVGQWTRAAQRETGPSLSVVEVWGAGNILLFLLVVLYAFQSLASKVLKYNVVIICVKFYEIGVNRRLVLWNFPMWRFFFGFGVH